MKLALIPPFSLVEYTTKTQYQLYLPQLLTASTRYQLSFRKHCLDSHQHVILDNGAAEGEMLGIDTLANMASTCKISELVVPDVLGDMNGTLELAEQFQKDVIPPHGFMPLPFDLMFVVQGQNMMEVLKCAEWALGQSWINTLGIPRHMIDTLDDLKARTRIINILSSKPNAKPMHALGANATNPMEIMALTDPFRTEQKFLRGMDTSLPFSYSFYQRKMDEVDTGQWRVRRPDKYFERKSIEFSSSLVDYNVNFLLHYTEQSRALHD